MYRQTFNKIYLFVSLLFLFVFFFVIEWRWEAMLLGLPDTKPHLLTAVVSIFVILFGCLNLKKQKVIFWLVLILIGYFIIISALNTKELINVQGYNMATEFGVWSVNLALFLVASNQTVWEYIYNHTKTVVGLYILFLIPLFFLLLYTGCAVESKLNLRSAIWISGLVDNSYYGVSYQSLGDKLALLSFGVLSLDLRKYIKFNIALVTFAALYITGGKASMVGYIFACGVYYIISLINNKYYVRCGYIIFLSTCLLYGGWSYVVGNDTLQNSDNWLLRSIARGTVDISVSGRRIIEEQNKTTRSSRLMIGNYKFDYKLGRPGSYTHSALGIVDYYGGPIFIAVSGIWFYLFFKLLLLERKKRVVNTALMSMLFYTLLFTIARFPPVNYLFYWTLGIATCALSRQIYARELIISRG